MDKTPFVRRARFSALKAIFNYLMKTTRNTYIEGTLWSPLFLLCGASYVSKEITFINFRQLICFLFAYN